MPLPNTADGDLFITVHAAHVNNQLGEFTCGWQSSGNTGGGIPYQYIIDQLDASYQAQFQGQFDASVTLRPSRLYVIDRTTGLTIQQAVTTDVPTSGTDTVGTIPTQVAAVITKLTGVPGRKGRGRCFHPFLRKSVITRVGELLGSEQTALTSAYQTLFAPRTFAVGPGVTNINPGLLSRKPLPVGYTPLNATGFFCQPTLGTQRRRGDYGRPNP
jgi:hypothetical protein